MRSNPWAVLAAASSLWFAAPGAFAASDYFLKIDGIDGETKSSGHVETIEIQSWSFGASNPTTVGQGGGAGKVNVQDISVMAAAPRDAVSGQATGKRQHKPATVVSSDTAGDVAAEPAVGSVSSISVVTAPDSTTAAQLDRACASGKHIKNVSITGKGRIVEMQDVVVTSCSSTANGRVHEFRGHVTLIK